MISESKLNFKFRVKGNFICERMAIKQICILQNGNYFFTSLLLVKYSCKSILFMNILVDFRIGWKRNPDYASDSVDELSSCSWRWICQEISNPINEVRMGNEGNRVNQGYSL